MLGKALISERDESESVQFRGKGGKSVSETQVDDSQASADSALDGAIPLVLARRSRQHRIPPGKTIVTAG